MDRGAQRGQRNGDLFHLRRAGFACKGRACSGIEQQKPRQRGAREIGFHALAIKPALDLNGVCAGNRYDVRVDTAAHAMRSRSHDAGKARAVRRKHDSGFCRAHNCFARRRIAGETRLREGLATDWLQPQGCLLNVVLGIVLVLMMASLVQALQRVLARGRSA